MRKKKEETVEIKINSMSILDEACLRGKDVESKEANNKSGDTHIHV